MSGRIEIITEKSGDEALELIRHDAAHVFAEAMLELYPGVQISIGPPIENGFYYDVDLPDGVTLNEDDFPAIEARMREHIDADEEFVREDVPVAVALDRYRGEGQSYKVELIEDLVKNAPADAPVETVSLYTNGKFVDLCRGPHAPTTKRIKAFKLQSVAGAYWRGDSSNKMLTRVYGTAFFSKKDLEEYLERLERARQNDHRRLGPLLGHVRLLRDRAGLGVLVPAGRRGVQRAGQAQPRDGACRAATPRSRRRSSSTARSGRPQATGTSTTTTCSSPSPRTGRWRSSR